MNTLRPAAILWIRDALIGLLAFAGWPRWSWAHRAVDRLEVLAEALAKKSGVRA